MKRKGRELTVWVRGRKRKGDLRRRERKQRAKVGEREAGMGNERERVKG